MITCAKVQERIALGESLPDSERLHLSSCEHCTSVAETHSLLDASLEALVEPVPSAFAERVMSRIAEQEAPRSKRWFHAGWAELALANAALACALLNTLRFLANILIPSVSLGGTP